MLNINWKESTKNEIKCVNISKKIQKIDMQKTHTYVHTYVYTYVRT